MEKVNEVGAVCPSCGGSNTTSIYKLYWDAARVIPQFHWRCLDCWQHFNESFEDFGKRLAEKHLKEIREAVEEWSRMRNKEDE